MTFTTTRLINQRVLIEGADAVGNTGSIIVSSVQWDEVNQKQNYNLALESFNDTVAEFFAPLDQALNALEQVNRKPDQDPIAYVVFQEGSDPSPGEVRHIVHLDEDAIILRLIKEGMSDRLRWIDSNQLAILTYEPPVIAVAPVKEDPEVPEVVSYVPGVTSSQVMTDPPL